MSPPLPFPAPTGRSTYRHGDLRRALIEAGVELARAGGPQAVVLREATRRVGVVPNAAYRHFANREALLVAVRSVALSAVADAMSAAMPPVDSGDAATVARAKLRAVGAGYLRFARLETGLFRTAFTGRFRVGEMAPDPAAAGTSGMNPFQTLTDALDAMAAAGALPKERRPGAEFAAWSAVHGMALLAIEGPLADLPEPVRERFEVQVVDMVLRGI